VPVPPGGPTEAQSLPAPAPSVVAAETPSLLVPAPPGGPAQAPDIVLASLPVDAADEQSPLVPPPPGGPADAQNPLLSAPPVEATEAESPPLPPPRPFDAPDASPPETDMALAVPLPAPRPSDAPAAIAPAVVAQEAPSPTAPLRSRRTRMPKPPATTEDNRSFFAKFFGGQSPPPGATLAYASAKDTAAPVRPSGSTTSFFSSGSIMAPGTAVYDISRRTVTLPSGERLEAHSGLGDKLDDPRQVSVKMRGATPPHVYDLTEREAPFHGVRALRLTPVGGDAAVYGRVGLLAHTYMLGPRGDSNGCISFKDYNKFLQAYLRGDIKRLAVVAGNG